MYACIHVCLYICAVALSLTVLQTIALAEMSEEQNALQLQLEDIAKEAIYTKNDAVISPEFLAAESRSKSSIAQSQYMSAMQEQVDANSYSRNYVAEKTGERFIEYTTVLTTTEMLFGEITATIHLRERTMYERHRETEMSTVPKYMGEFNEHLLQFENHDGTWYLMSDKILNGFDSASYVLHEDDGSISNFHPPLTASQLGVETTERPPMPFSLFIPFIQGDSASKQVRSRSNSKNMIPTGVNRDAVVDYAKRHAATGTYNSSYRDFNDQGGDCTNFVSQSMRAGGWQDDTGWYRSTSNWWYNQYNQTYTWTSVYHFYEFTRKSGRGQSVSHFSDLNPGDVLQADFDYNGNGMDHSMVVTGKSGDELYLSYHTSDKLDASLSWFQSQVGSSSYYGWDMN